MLELITCSKYVWKTVEIPVNTFITLQLSFTGKPVIKNKTEYMIKMSGKRILYGDSLHTWKDTAMNLSRLTLPFYNRISAIGNPISDKKNDLNNVFRGIII